MDSTKHTRNITEQLSQLRDLLIVIERSDDAPDVLYKIAIEKSQHITSLVEAWRAEADPAPVEIPAEYALWIDNDTEACQPECDADEATDVIEVQQFAIEHTEAEVEEVLLDSVMPMQAPDEQPAAVEKENIEEEDTEEEEIIEEEEEYIAPFVEDDIVADEVPAENVEATEYNEPADEDLFDEVPDDDIYTDEPVHEEEIVDIVDEAVDDVVVVDYDVVASDELVESYDDDDEFDDDDDFMADDDDDDDDDEGDDVETLLEQELVIDEFYNRGEPFDNDTITIGEMMSVRQAKELRKALSLNDRFRFRRELFGNSDVTMNDTLNLIDTMNDYNEALEYLTQDLDWSPEEPVVQEFLQLVERHFKK